MVEEIVTAAFQDSYEPLHQLGPDYIIPTENILTWLPDGVVKVDVQSDGPSSNKPMSIVTYLQKTVDKFPHNVALAVKRNDQWLKWTYAEYLNEIKLVARGFIKLGLSAFHGVGILGFNSPEWHIAHFAAIFANGISAGIYVTNSPNACFHILNDCSANIVVVENELQLNKVLKIRENLPNLKAIVQFTGKPIHPDVLSWSDLIEVGKSLPEEILQRRINGLAINQCALLIYTSGTTGNPKGVMINHDNITFLTERFLNLCWKHDAGHEVDMTYLPLSHIAGTLKDIYVAIGAATAVYFATPDALKDRLVQHLKEIQPTNFIGVPRMYEKLYLALQEIERNLGFIQRNLLAWSKKHVLNYYLNKPTPHTIAYILSRKFICQKIQKLIGMDKARVCFCGGAPVSSEVQNYLYSFDLNIIEGYGLSESTGFHTFNTEDTARIGSVGNINHTPDMKIKIVSPDDEGSGEILMQGRNICMGYLKLEDQTKELINEERWLDSGDLGKLDKEGYLYITGRKKELLITSGGENVPPVLIEETVKELLPVISNCVLIGDQRKYLTLLITLKAELDPDTGISMNQLTGMAIDWCQSVGSQSQMVSDILTNKDDKVMRALQDGIDRYNKEKSISTAQHIQKWLIVKDDFSIAGGELGPTLKLRRPFILKKYAEVIESLYT